MPYDRLLAAGYSIFASFLRKIFLYLLMSHIGYFPTYSIPFLSHIFDSVKFFINCCFHNQSNLMMSVSLLLDILFLSLRNYIRVSG